MNETVILDCLGEKLKKYKGMIFDLDGTLIDTISDIGESMNEVLKEFKFPTYEIEDYKIKVGGGFRGLAINCLPADVEDKVIKEVTNRFSEIYDKKFNRISKSYESIGDVLQQLVDKNILLGVNSNKDDKYSKILVKENFPNIPFVNILGNRKNISPKPDPYSALEIIKSMELLKDEVLYIGDSKTDIQTAKNAGIDSLGVVWGFRGIEELEKYGATHIISEPYEILKFI